MATPPRLDRHIEEEPCRHTGRRSITRSLWLTASLDLFLNRSDISVVGRGARHRPRGFGQLFASLSHLALTLAWVGFSVWVSGPWRDELEDAIGPVMAWVIPIFLAYIPGLVIGFMISTLLITRYQELPLSLRGATGQKASGRR